MDTVRTFKFGVRIDRQACKPKNAKVGQKGRGVRHMTYFYNFGTLLYLEWMGKARKFGVWIELEARKPKTQK